MKIPFFLVMILTVFFFVDACEAKGKEESQFVGKWETRGKWKPNNTEKEFFNDLELFKDGTGRTGKYHEITPINWKVDDNRLMINTFSKGRSYNYTMSDGELILTDDKGVSVKYVDFKQLAENAKKNIKKNSSKFTDSRDGKTYKTIKIGEQVWMAENFNYATEFGSCCYENKEENCKKYGRLYNLETAMKIAPQGWHLPSDDEWRTLVDYVSKEDGNEKNVAGKLLKATSGWNNKGNGTDTYGFSALPGGIRLSSGSFDFIGTQGFWWNKDRLYSGSPSWYTSNGKDHMGFETHYKEDAFSVRLIQDTIPIKTKIDDKKYKTVKIGVQTWMAENLNYATESGSWCYDNSTANCDEYYGRLYDWATAMTACPTGWHLPSDDEWQRLLDYIGGSDIAGRKLKAKSVNGTDDYEFRALLGFTFSYDNENPKKIDGYVGTWWSSTENDSSSAFSRVMYYHSEVVVRYSLDKSSGFSVRCLKD